MFVIGRGNRGRETYPSPPNAATGALRNRNIAGDVVLTVPFTPSNSVVAAILFTPKVSGVIQVSASLGLLNGATPDIYAADTFIVPGTGLSVTGGEVTVNGWVVGSNTPPVLGGVLGSNALTLVSVASVAGGALGALLTFGMSQPLPIGVPVIVAVVMGETGGGHALAALAATNLSVLELP